MSKTIAQGFSLEEIIMGFVNDDFSQEAIEKALKSTGLIGAKTQFNQMRLSRIALAYGLTDYQFTQQDLRWLDYADDAVVYRLLTGTRIFFIDIKCDPEEYYVPCAAIICLLNLAFDWNCVYVFRTEYGMVIGTARNLFRSVQNNYVLSGLINEADYYIYRDFLDLLMCSRFNEIPSLIIENSSHEDPFWAQEEAACFHELLGLEDGQYFYIESYDGSRKELSNIGKSNAESSYDILNAALAEEERVSALREDTSEDYEPVGDQEDLGVSQEAFDDAELLLQELLEKDKQ